jgi:predicted SAM-dependent methyltransferase
MANEQGIRLHIGGKETRDGWQIFNVVAAPGVDYVGHCCDLSALPDGSCQEVYASHVLEHLAYNGELQRALREIRRVLEPGGTVRISVPDLEILCRLFLEPKLSVPDRFHIMRMMYGGRADQHDIHYVGFSFDFLSAFLSGAKFCNIRRVGEFGIFQDTSTLRLNGEFISLNVEAEKPLHAQEAPRAAAA